LVHRPGIFRAHKRAGRRKKDPPIHHIVVTAFFQGKEVIQGMLRSRHCPGERDSHRAVNTLK
jgi:hypothetical protein